MIKPRTAIAAFTLSASAFVGLTVLEDYRPAAYLPTKNDVPTIGFGTTEGVKLGDTITPPKALSLALRDVQKFEGALKQCVTVPLYQHEYDAYISLTYNIGAGAFCVSTLVKKLNAGEYEAACTEIKRWNRQAGKVLPGLTNRREAEYRQCMGLA
ncbi:MAG TPA: lysozyme [Nitrosospira sp.]